jgi:tripartite-type tricarboxylate transporter receptor subunit TctC
MRVRALRWFLVALIAAMLPGAVAAETYPSRPIKLVVPFPPGGPNDIIARVVAQRMSELLGQTVVIDNRSGAGGVVGTDAVAKAAPDGYTIGICSAGAIAISASLGEKVPYDSTKDLTAITLVASVPELLVVPAGLNVDSFAELVKLVNSKPGQLNFASTGPGSMPHLAGELLKINGKLNIVHVPYRGAAPAVNDLLGGQVQMMFADIPVLLPHVQAGKLKALAIASKARAPSLPDVKTLGELGLANVDAENWYGMIGPAKMPADIVEKLNAVTVQALKSPGVIEKLSPQGANLVGDRPEQFAAFIKTEIAKWAKVVEASGAKQQAQ